MRKHHRFLASLLLLGSATCAGAVTAKFGPGRPVMEPTEAGAELNFDLLQNINALRGNYVVLDLGDDTFALYAHLRQNGVIVEPGQRVRRGEVIARVGHSGSSMLFRDFVRVRGGVKTRVARGAIGTGDVVESRPH